MQLHTINPNYKSDQQRSNSSKRKHFQSVIFTNLNPGINSHYEENQKNHKNANKRKSRKENRHKK